MIDEVMMLRHGRTQYNLEHRLQGQIDVPLDIVGQWQVDQTGFALASRYYWAKVNRLAEHPEAIAQPGPDAAASASFPESCARTRSKMMDSSSPVTPSFGRKFPSVSPSISRRPAIVRTASYAQ